MSETLLQWKLNIVFFLYCGPTLIAVNNANIESVAMETQKCFSLYSLCLATLWQVYVAGNNKTCLDVRVKWPIFLSDFDQTWLLAIDFS